MPSPRMSETHSPTDDRLQVLANVDTVVVKVGSRVLSDRHGCLDLRQIELLSEQLTKVADSGKQVALVSSGAVASGLGKLGWKNRPSDLAQLQAIASIGQAHLIQAYEKQLAQLGRHAAQILLTADDFDHRQRYLNLRNTITALLEMGVIPILNENDAIAVDELQTTFGDNDRLAAMVAGLFSRPALVILSDVEGLYERTPTADEPPPPVVSSVSQIDDRVLALAAVRPNQLSKGGMESKLRAAQFVTRSGAPVWIAGGRVENILPRLLGGDDLGTLFLPQATSLAPRKRWFGFSAQTVGSIVVDEGAGRALRGQGPSLLAAGVVQVLGTFEKGDVVSIRSVSGQEIARGLSNYDAGELQRIQGLRTAEIADVLGHRPYDEVVHRDNMVLV